MTSSASTWTVLELRRASAPFSGEPVPGESPLNGETSSTPGGCHHGPRLTEPSAPNPPNRRWRSADWRHESRCLSLGAIAHFATSREPIVSRK